VTLSFARRSREEGGATDDALAGGLLIAWGVMWARMVVLTAFIHPPLTRSLLLPFGAMAAVTLALAALFLVRTRTEERKIGGEVALRNPFSLTSAVEFALLFAAVLVVVKLVQQNLPGQGYYVVAALAGLTDVDAITLSMAALVRDGATDTGTVTGALVVAGLANTVVKGGLVVALASAALRRRAIWATALLLGVGAAVAFLP
jgi:uncharacterized membrane protein (DUF4010 family)